MKKVITILILLVLVSALGCGSKTTQQPTTAEDTGTASEQVDALDTELAGIDDLDEDFLDSDLDSLDSELDFEI